MRATSSVAPSAASFAEDPKLRREQVTAAENVERQVAVAVVVTVKVPAFLFAVERIVGGVEVDDDARRWLRHEHPETDRRTAARWPPASWSSLWWRSLADLAGVLQPVQRRFAGERGARLVDDGGERRIEAQRVVVDEIFVAEREAEDALAQGGPGSVCLTASGMR